MATERPRGLPAVAATPAPVAPRYFTASRAPRYSLLYALPLLLLYEGLAAVLPGAAAGGVRNGADVMLTRLFIAIAGSRGPLLFGVALIGTAGFLVARDLRRHPGRLRPGVFAGMFAESVLLAMLFGVVVGTITARLLGRFAMLAIGGGQIATMDAPTQVMLSLGAGLYEELLFRVLLVSALAYLFRALPLVGVRLGGVLAAVVGALLFSAFHYIGPYGDALELRSFVFRFISGIFFSGLFLLRGFGIVAWTHALYDVFLVAM
jgi:hypothetical protein